MSAADPAAGRPLRLLIVDDQPLILGELAHGLLLSLRVVRRG